MSDIVINDDFTALAELLDATEELSWQDGDTPAEALAVAQRRVLERVRAEVAAKSDGLRRAIVWYGKLAEDAKRVMKQAESRAALIRAYVKGEMQVAGVRWIKTASGSLTLRGNGGLQPLSVNLDELPDEYTKVTVTMPHQLWSAICDHFAECGKSELKAGDLMSQPGVTVKTEPDNARIREALGKPCERCGGEKRVCFKETQLSEVWDDCPVCGGTGRFTIPGAKLEERGESLVVR